MEDHSPDDSHAPESSLVQRLDSYREQFTGVARQLEAGGVDLASMASGDGSKAVAEVEAADKLVQELDAVKQELQRLKVISKHGTRAIFAGLGRKEGSCRQLADHCASRVQCL